MQGEKRGDEWVASTKVGKSKSFLADAKGFVTELVRGDPQEPTFDRAYWGSAFAGIDGCQPLDDVPRVDVERLACGLHVDSVFLHVKHVNSLVYM